ncbi:antibiotic biosynthesis monooxygenase family protein [Leptospira sp. GIMC2001]|uniref:antibiotic biosynthesis monooxygenase family protein n=1 Tax=Leptospira sp. GIMC2001 TaxID=1513297 RepID=UPI00234A3FF2|nr:antibiotic biosynthesis monooxygenase [Leptospira sp. GIMC2001]WCL51170.1 antibiotic biosynthesis monooxygenase [Leptospira sp. GIMC2001]
MILEVAILKVKNNCEREFEIAFAEASMIISQMQGYLNHELLKCIEQDNQYLLLVRWEKLEDHTEGFRKSKEYLQWKKLLHDFYDPFPTVEHYKSINLHSFDV